MPQIPVLTDQVQSAPQTDARLQVHATPEAFGAGLSEGINAVTGVASAIAQRELAKQKDNADALAVQAADKKLADWETANIYDSTNGALAVKGKDALGLPDKVFPALNNEIGDIHNGLTDQTQKIAFQRLANQRQVEIQRTVHRHVAQEYENYDKQETAAYVADSQNTAVNNYADPVRVQKEIQRQTAVLRSFGMRQGVPNDMIDLQVTKAVSDTQVGVIGKMLAIGDYQGAKDYYNANKDQIEGTAQAAVQKAVDAGALRGDAQQQTDKLVATYSKEGDALAAARQITDPQLRDAVVQRVSQRFAQNEDIKAQDLKDTIDNAVKTITNGGTVDNIPPQDWEQIPRTQRAQLRALQNRGEWYQDDKKWYAFTQLPADKLAKMNLYTDVRPYTDDAHWNRALQMQNDAKAALAGDSSNLTSTLTFKNRLDNSLKTAGLFPNGTAGLTGDDAARYAKIETEASHEVQAQEQATGHKLTGDDIQKITDKLALDQVFVHHYFSSDVARQIINVKPEDVNSTYVPIDKVPDNFKSRLTNYGQSLGVTVTNDMIERAYAASLMGDDERVKAILAGQ